MPAYKYLFSLMLVIPFSGCGAGTTKINSDTAENVAQTAKEKIIPAFDADSAYAYVSKQVSFGPRISNTSAHKTTGDWLASELKRHGFEVIEQTTQIMAADGMNLNVRNIFGSLNPETPDRILLLAHWDTRPWADEDPDPSKRNLPVDGANDGASGVGVLLEIARHLHLSGSKAGVDILFVDAEDRGIEGDEDSWALGTQYFAENPPIENYSPNHAILLDMVGGENAVFHREYFSEINAPEVAAQVWQAGADAGYGDRFQNRPGSAVTDDHVRLIEKGIPAIDIIEFNPETGGFNNRWHTTSDTMDGISHETLKAVGETILLHINRESGQ